MSSQVNGLLNVDCANLLLDEKGYHIIDMLFCFIAYLDEGPGIQKMGSRKNGAVLEYIWLMQSQADVGGLEKVFESL